MTEHISDLCKEEIAEAKTFCVAGLSLNRLPNIDDVKWAVEQGFMKGFHAGRDYTRTKTIDEIVENAKVMFKKRMDEYDNKLNEIKNYQGHRSVGQELDLKIKARKLEGRANELSDIIHERNGWEKNKTTEG